MRPVSLAEVIDATRSEIWIPLAEFMDEFYMLHGDNAGQQGMIDDEPHVIGDETVDAYIAAVAEHLALRWGLSVPEWVNSEERAGPSEPFFRPDTPTMRGQYLVESPFPFKKRNIFTNREPLQRARWPQSEAKIEPLF
ncbi:hypothetical protein G6L37_06700 [Agrobacterium rubi]|nr:hypothetical protein [Agrobacterium rubi]NTF25053.1 hypothetical protein [Agrobacterium rubi]